MNIKSKFSILVATIFSLSFGLVTLVHADGHGHGMNVPKIEVTTVLEGAVSFQVTAVVVGVPLVSSGIHFVKPKAVCPTHQFSAASKHLTITHLGAEFRP